MLLPLAHRRFPTLATAADGLYVLTLGGAQVRRSWVPDCGVTDPRRKADDECAAPE